MIPKEYRWMKPKTSCRFFGESDFIMGKPYSYDYMWWVTLKYRGASLCGMLQPNNDLYAIPSERESQEFQARINRVLKEMRCV